MRRYLTIAALLGSTSASANGTFDPDDPTQGLGASVGVASGSHSTPGGLRVAGHYLYQFNQDDFIEGGASFTLGSGDPACFYNRENDFVCDHGLVDGKGVEITGAIRHFFLGQGGFHPFTRVGLGVGLVRFSDDSVTGLAITARGGAGIHAEVAHDVAVVIQAELALGFGGFGHDLGLEAQLGACVLAGAEFTLE